MQNVALAGILFLSFLRLLSDLVEGIYVAGLLRLEVPVDLVALVFLLGPVILLLSRRVVATRILVLGLLVLAARAVEPHLEGRARLLVAGHGVMFFLILLPGLLWRAGRSGDRAAATAMGGGLFLAVALAGLLKAANSGIDISTEGWGRAIGWALAAFGAALLVRDFRRAAPSDEPEAPAEERARFARIAVLSLGAIGALVLLHFGFASPNVVARWAEADHGVVLGLGGAALVVFAWLARAGIAARRVLLLGMAILFVLAMFIALGAHQPAFPKDRVAYPFEAAAPTSFQNIAFYLMVALAPAMLVAFGSMCGALVALRPTLRSLGGGFALGGLFLLVMIVAHVATTAYDYLPVVGPFFRDRFASLHLVAGIALLAGIIAARGPRAEGSNARVPASLVALLALLGIGSWLGAHLNEAEPIEPPEDGRIRFATFNLQQGYSAAGRENHEGQCELLRSIDADIIGLQESDTNRIALGNKNLVRYFADSLGMYSYYGPPVPAGTFGVALLSRFPIRDARTLYLGSRGEQTAAIAAEIEAAGRVFNVFVTHLGNGGPREQLDDLLGVVVGRENAIVMGDFNFAPGTEQYGAATSALEDAWIRRWPGGTDDRGADPRDRIDHIFVARGLAVTDARYLNTPASDHPLLWVAIGE